jgi:predicted DNA-binding ribbon-helix-helix protein
VALRERITRSQLFTRILSLKPKDLSFTVAVRQYLVQYFRDAATEDGHAEAGHGPISFRLMPDDARAA